MLLLLSCCRCCCFSSPWSQHLEKSNKKKQRTELSLPFFSSLWWGSSEGKVDLLMIMMRIMVMKTNLFIWSWWSYSARVVSFPLRKLSYSKNTIFVLETVGHFHPECEFWLRHCEWSSPTFVFPAVGLTVTGDCVLITVLFFVVYFLAIHFFSDCYPILKVFLVVWRWVGWTVK